MESLPPIPEWISLEHQVAQILTQQEQHGWYFNESAARELESSLRKEYEETSKLLRNRYPYVSGSVFTPSELIGPKAMSLMLHSPNSKN